MLDVGAIEVIEDIDDAEDSSVVLLDISLLIVEESSARLVVE